MSKRLALVHTSATLVPVFQDLVNQFLGDKDLIVYNIVDDSLIKNTIAAGTLTKETSSRVVAYAASAKQAGADYILFTCSYLGLAVENAENLEANIPLGKLARHLYESHSKAGNGQLDFSSVFNLKKTD